MERKKVGDAEFAALIGKDRSLVNRLRRGDVRPTLEVAAKIEAVTENEVPMQAWVDDAPKADGRQTADVEPSRKAVA